MATRSYIFTETQNNNYIGSYCHWDGYPEHVGSILLENYTSQEQVDRLCNLGGFSALKETVVETSETQYADEVVAEVNTARMLLLMVKW